MPITSNSSPLIALAQIGRLRLLKDLYGTVLIPPAVQVECIDRGRAIGAPDVHEIEKAVQEGWIQLTHLAKNWRTQARRLMQQAQIRPGEAEALIVARGKQMALILDDAEARAIARSLNIHHLGTLMVPYEAFARRLISYQKLVAILIDLSKVLWVSPAVIAEILRRAQEGTRE